MNNELLLQSNGPISFLGARTSIHNPSLKEIGLIGEDIFRSGIHFLNFSKELLSDEDKRDLSGKTDFDIFMLAICDNNIGRYRNDVRMVLSLLFPNCELSFSKEKGIKLTDVVNNNYTTYINNENFDEFKDILVSMFDMHDVESGGSYNPADARAAKIAEKLKKGKNKVSKSKGQNIENISVYARYVSILSVGERKDKNMLMEYTVYQLLDEFKRWQLETAYDMNLKARLAGATNLDEVENWMDDIHKNTSNK